MESDRVWARARRSCARRSTARTRPTPSAAGWTGCATAASRRSPGSTRARSSATSATRARCAAASSRRAIAEAQARERVAAEPPMAGRDLAREVTPRAGDGPRRRRRRPADPRHRHRHQGLDRAQARRPRRAGHAAPLHRRRADELLATRRRRVLPGQRPGRPGRAGLRRRRRCASSSARRPVWGICLGHQLLCQAVGLETYKLPFGHRGANHPVKDLATGRIEITSQNHGFAVARARTAPRAWTPTSPCAGRPTSARPSSRTSTSTTARSRG